MAHEPFEPLDESMMRELEELRQRQMPPQLLQNFSAQVQERILQREKPQRTWEVKRAWLPVWSPVLAVLILALGLAVGSWPGRALFWPQHRVQLAQADVSDLAEDIAALRELDAWTQEDESALGVSEEDQIAELEAVV